MILYQLAKWMEEHRRLKKIIQSTEGEVGLLVHKKEQVERQMMSQAYLWMGQQETETTPMQWIEPLELDAYELLLR